MNTKKATVVTWAQVLCNLSFKSHFNNSIMDIWASYSCFADWYIYEAWSAWLTQACKSEMSYYCLWYWLGYFDKSFQNRKHSKLPLFLFWCAIYITYLGYMCVVFSGQIFSDQNICLFLWLFTSRMNIFNQDGKINVVWLLPLIAIIQAKQYRKNNF